MQNIQFPQPPQFPQFPQPPQLIRTLNDNKWMNGKIEMFLRSVDQIVVETHGIWEHVLETIDSETVVRKTYKNGILILSEIDTNIPEIDPDFCCLF